MNIAGVECTPTAWRRFEDFVLDGPDEDWPGALLITLWMPALAVYIIAVPMRRAMGLK